MDLRKLQIYIGTDGKRSRALFGGTVVPGVKQVRVDVYPDGLPTVTLTIYAKDCEIIQKDYKP